MPHFLAASTISGIASLLLLALVAPSCQRASARAACWRLSQLLCLILLAIATASLVHALRNGPALSGGLRLDALAASMLMLVSFLGWIIVRYSQRYLIGEAGRMRYLGWLNAILAAVCLLAASANLLVLALAWSATGIALHKLLTFYDDRRAALLAAHKKFLLSRLADLALAGALLLLYRELGTLDIGAIRLAAANEQAGAALQGAALLLALCAILRCAQLPFHGWLIQVMEAPTPVSALLHAGIVNIGGYVLIRLAPLLQASPAAQILLAAVGGATVALAALVMSTRVSIKVHLAWSTCAQMGFMLIECALGAYALALLHLIGHSLYKAHAFLASGSVVAAYRVRRIAPQSAVANPWLQALCALGLVAVGGLIASPWLTQPAHWLLFALLALALGALPALASSAMSRVRAAVAAVLLTALYLALHHVFDTLFSLPATAPHPLALVIVAICLAMLGASSLALRTAPASRLSRWLYPHAFAGFHLDEGFTVLTQRLWPARLPRPVRDHHATVNFVKEA